MANLRVIYKKRTAGFGNVEERRIIRAAEESQSRKNRRSEEFANNRRIAESITPSTSSALGAQDTDQGQPDAQNSITADRRTRLLKWKAERELQKRIAMQKKQPAFRAGVIHHKPNSPKFLHQVYPAVKPPKPITPRVTRATAKRMAAKKNCTIKDEMAPTLPTKALKGKKIPTKPKTLETSFAPKKHQFKAPEGLSVFPMFGPEALEDSRTEPKTVPVYFSPYVVSARGKRASRKEQLQNIESGECESIEAQSKEADAQSTGTSDHQVQLTTSHFRKMTEKEVNRLRALCQHWIEIKTDNNIPEDAQLVINQTIGQTNLLINKKIEQFKQLIIDCETGCGDQLVTCQDLQGFWEMMYMQVENCDSRFDKLTQLQGRNWEEEEPPIVKRDVAPKKPAANKKVLPSKSSSVRDMIRAARRKQMELQKNEVNNSPAVILGKTDNAAPGESSRLSAIKFDGGFFMVESPKKTVTPRSISKTVLSQQPVPSDEAKRRRSALHLIRLSQILKPPETKPVTVETDPTISYVNSRQTPCKSILKRTDVQETASGVKKSRNKVIFSENQESLESNKSWLDEPRNTISDAQDKGAETQTEINVKKRLDLSDSDSDAEETEQVNSLDDTTVDSHRDVNDKTTSNTETTETKQNEQAAPAPLRKDPTDSIRTTRRHRQRVLNERSEEMVSEVPNIQANELDTHRTDENFGEPKEDQKENEKPGSPEITKRRRSTRKSVRFTGEECTACVDVKPVHPMTPRVKRRSSKALTQMQNADDNSIEKTKVKTPSKEGSKDLISWDTPKDIPPRVRRSLRLQNVKPTLD